MTLVVCSWFHVILYFLVQQIWKKKICKPCRRHFFCFVSFFIVCVIFSKLYFVRLPSLLCSFGSRTCLIVVIEPYFVSFLLLLFLKKSVTSEIRYVAAILQKDTCRLSCFFSNPFFSKNIYQKSGVPARFSGLGASQPFAIFFASFSTELNEVGTSIKKPTSLILCDYLKILLVSRKTLSDKRRDGSYPRKYVNTPSSGVVCNSLFNNVVFF